MGGGGGGGTDHTGVFCHTKATVGMVLLGQRNKYDHLFPAGDQAVLQIDEG